MERNIFAPIPDFTNLTQPADREEWLRVIASNVEKQQQYVRANILNEAIKARVEALDRAPSVDSPVDLSEDVAPLDHSSLAERLRAELPNNSPDPCLAPGAVIAHNKSSKQAPIPPEVLIALEAVERLEAYDAHAKQVRNYYAQALKRTQSGKTAQDLEIGNTSPFDQRRRDSRRPPGS